MANFLPILQELHMPKPNILLAFNSNVRNEYLDDTQLARLESFATWDWFECEGGGIEVASDDKAAAAWTKVDAKGAKGADDKAADARTRRPG